jgi:hypothetical protein
MHCASAPSGLDCAERTCDATTAGVVVPAGTTTTLAVPVSESTAVRASRLPSARSSGGGLSATRSPSMTGAALPS